MKNNYTPARPKLLPSNGPLSLEDLLTLMLLQAVAAPTEFDFTAAMGQVQILANRMSDADIDKATLRAEALLHGNRS